MISIQRIKNSPSNDELLWLKVNRIQVFNNVKPKTGKAPIFDRGHLARLPLLVEPIWTHWNQELALSLLPEPVASVKYRAEQFRRSQSERHARRPLDLDHNADRKNPACLPGPCIQHGKTDNRIEQGPDNHHTLLRNMNCKTWAGYNQYVMDSNHTNHTHRQSDFARGFYSSNDACRASSACTSDDEIDQLLRHTPCLLPGHSSRNATYNHSTSQATLIPEVFFQCISWSSPISNDIK